MNIKSKTPILFFDTETTGIIKDDKGGIYSNGKMIQLAYRELNNGEKKDVNMFFNTDEEIQIGAMAVHGIYPELLEKKSGGRFLDNEYRDIIGKAFSDKILVAHNIDFDKDVLDKSGIEYSDRMIDTLKVAKIMWSEGFLKNSQNKSPEYVNLQYLRYFFELYEINDANGKAECTTAHDAFGDVIVLENVFYNLFEIIQNVLNKTDEEVLEIMQEMTKKEFTMIEVMRIGKYRGKTFEEVAEIDRGYLEWITNADFTDDIKYTCNVWLGKIEDKKFFS